MFIIIEGCDATGKSTLANAISEASDGEATVYHSGPPPEGDPYYWADQLIDYRETNESQIWDRFHWGNIVYGPLYGNQRVMELYEFEWYRQLVKAAGAVTIVATGSSLTIRKRAEEEGEEFTALDDIADIIRRFEYMSITLDNGEAWSHEIGDIEADPDSVVHLAKQQQAVVRLIPTTQWIGSPAPEVVFVTDDPLDGERPLAPTGEFNPFWQAISQLHAQHAEYSIISRDINIAQYLLTLPTIPVMVSLGKQASDRVRAYGLSTAVVRRPQEVEAKDIDRYAESLRAGMAIGEGVYYS